MSKGKSTPHLRRAHLGKSEIKSKTISADLTSSKCQIQILPKLTSPRLNSESIFGEKPKSSTPHRMRENLFVESAKISTPNHFGQNSKVSTPRHNFVETPKISSLHNISEKQKSLSRQISETVFIEKPRISPPHQISETVFVEKPKISKSFQQWASFDSSSEASSGDDGLRILKSTNYERSDKISHLKQELEECRDEMERMKDRLADRDLEIKILTKRLTFRRDPCFGNVNEVDNSVATANSLPCTKCRDKDGLVSELYQKLRNLENIVEAFCTSTDDKMMKIDNIENDSAIPEEDLSTILQNVNDLNQIITENQRDIHYVESGAQFQKPSVISIAFFRDGFKLGDSNFRSYKEDTSQTFLKDLLDGFFPAEMQSDFPEGVFFLVDDRRFEIGSRKSLARTPFAGLGRRLESRPGSAQTIFPPISRANSARPGSVISTCSRANIEQKNQKRALKSAKDSPKMEGTPMRTYAPFKRSSRSSVDFSSDICKLKIFGLATDPFMLELVSYDTVKTLKGILSNMMKSQKIDLTGFHLFTGFPKRYIDDESMTLGDLNLTPNGIIHLSRIKPIGC